MVRRIDAPKSGEFDDTTPPQEITNALKRACEEVGLDLKDPANAAWFKEKSQMGFSGGFEEVFRRLQQKKGKS